MANENNNRILYPDIELKHRLPLQIRFGDYDTFGHINNNSYMAYLDLGKSEFLCYIMGKRSVPSEFAAAIVNINVDFLAPTTIGENIEVRTGVVRLGERSFTVYQRIVNPDTEVVKVQATTVLAGFDISTQSSAPLQTSLTTALKKSLSL